MKVPARSRRQGGFTLIEMAIVLVIIGMIIAAVTVGKDTMRTAEANKVYSKFISPWNQAAYSYFQKAGVVPACTDAATCVAEMTKVGITLPSTFTMTDQSGADATVAIKTIADDRTGTNAKGGMIVTFTAPQSVAYMVDGILDANLADTDGTSGTGATKGIVRWTAVNGAAGTDSSVDFTVRLRDIPGKGSGT